MGPALWCVALARSVFTAHLFTTRLFTTHLCVTPHHAFATGCEPDSYPDTYHLCENRSNR